MKYKEITEKIIGPAYSIHHYFGFGFLEKAYENALAIEMRKCGLKFEQQVPMKVYYNDEIVGEYTAYFIVEGKVLVEIKSVKKIEDAHHSQIINYLKALHLEVGLLINFGPDIEFKRKILTMRNPRKSA